MLKLPTAFESISSISRKNTKKALHCHDCLPPSGVWHDVETCRRFLITAPPLPNARSSGKGTSGRRKKGGRVTEQRQGLWDDFRSKSKRLSNAGHAALRMSLAHSASSVVALISLIIPVILPNISKSCTDATHTQINTYCASILLHLVNENHCTSKKA
jgi:hypothetical protein